MGMYHFWREHPPLIKRVYQSGVNISPPMVVKQFKVRLAGVKRTLWEVPQNWLVIPHGFGECACCAKANHMVYQKNIFILCVPFANLKT